MPLRAGNVRERTLQEIWETSLVLQQFRSPRLKGACGDCALARGDSPLCVGCRARAFALRGDPLEEDPWCLRGPLRERTAEPLPAEWTIEATERLSHVPSFIRSRVKQVAEAYARQQGLSQVTPDVLYQLRRRAYGVNPGGWKSRT